MQLFTPSHSFSLSRMVSIFVLYCVLFLGLAQAAVFAAPYGEGAYGGDVYNSSTTPTSSRSSRSSSSSRSSGCSAWPPVGVPDLFQINRANGSATLYFTPTNDNTRNYHVVYGYSEGDQRFGLLSAPVTPDTNNGVQIITINDLNPKHEYWFSVIPVNGCATGNWSNWLQATREKGRLSIIYRYVPEFVRQRLP